MDPYNMLSQNYHLYQKYCNVDDHQRQSSSNCVSPPFYQLHYGHQQELQLPYKPSLSHHHHQQQQTLHFSSRRFDGRVALESVSGYTLLRDMRRDAEQSSWERKYKRGGKPFSGDRNFGQHEIRGQSCKYMRSNDGTRRRVKQYKSKQQTLFSCELCKVNCSSQVNLQSHLNGRKHLSKLKQSRKGQDASMSSRTQLTSLRFRSRVLGEQGEAVAPRGQYFSRIHASESNVDVGGERAVSKDVKIQQQSVATMSEERPTLCSRKQDFPATGSDTILPIGGCDFVSSNHRVKLDAEEDDPEEYPKGGDEDYKEDPQEDLGKATLEQEYSKEDSEEDIKEAVIEEGLEETIVMEEEDPEEYPEEVVAEDEEDPEEYLKDVIREDEEGPEKYPEEVLPENEEDFEEEDPEEYFGEVIPEDEEEDPEEYPDDDLIQEKNENPVEVIQKDECPHEMEDEEEDPNEEDPIEEQ